MGEWTKNLTREDCPQKLFELVREKAEQDKLELMNHIDTRISKIEPAWRMSIANRTHSIINSLLLVILFLLMTTVLTSC